MCQKVICALKPQATRGRVIFLETLFAASDKRSPKVAAPQSGFTLGWSCCESNHSIILRFNSKATYLSKIKILMRLRHHNFCAALLATVRASNSCACPAWLSIARSYAGRLVTYQVSLLYLLPRKEICGQISTRPLVALAV